MSAMLSVDVREVMMVFVMTQTWLVSGASINVVDPGICTPLQVSVVAQSVLNTGLAPEPARTSSL